MGDTGKLPPNPTVAVGVLETGLIDRMPLGTANSGNPALTGVPSSLPSAPSALYHLVTLKSNYERKEGIKRKCQKSSSVKANLSIARSSG